MNEKGLKPCSWNLKNACGDEGFKTVGFKAVYFPADEVLFHLAIPREIL